MPCDENQGMVQYSNTNVDIRRITHISERGSFDGTAKSVCTRQVPPVDDGGSCLFTLSVSVATICRNWTISHMQLCHKGLVLGHKIADGRYAQVVIPMIRPWPYVGSQ
jgi:hypothetical protein